MAQARKLECGAGTPYGELFSDTLEMHEKSAARMSDVYGTQVDVVYTPAHLRGRGYAGAVTAEVSRAALAAGARDVVLFADLSNPTSNALYQRLRYRTLTDWAVYDFACAAPEVTR